MGRQIRASILIAMRDQRLRCAICDDIIGVYEPVMVRDGAELRRTSLLNDPGLTAEHGPMHRDCAVAGEPTDAND